MRIYKSIFTLFLAATLFVACEETLDVEPEGTTSGDTIPDSLEDFQGRWAKLYAGSDRRWSTRGDGAADIQGIDGGFSNYNRLYWKLTATFIRRGNHRLE